MQNKMEKLIKEKLIIYNEEKKDLYIKIMKDTIDEIGSKYKNKIFKLFYKKVKQYYNLDDGKIYSKSQTNWWILRGYSDINEIKEKIKEFQRSNSKQCVEYWQKKGFSLDESKEKISEYQKKCSNNGRNSIDYWLKKSSSLEEAKELQYKDRRETSIRCVEYWQKKGFSLKDAKIKVNEVQNVKERYIKQHGEEDGTKLFYDRCITDKTGYFTIDWFKERYGEKRGQIKYNERIEKLKLSAGHPKGYSQKEYLIEKFGEKIGLEKYNDYIILMKKINKLSYYIEKYGEYEGKLKYAIRHGYGSYEEYKKYKFGEYTEKFYDKDYRLMILKEQFYICPSCLKNISNDENMLFDLHHIDYDKKNDSRENLIWLCRSCHSKTSAAKIKRDDFKKQLKKLNKKIIEETKYAKNKNFIEEIDPKIRCT